MSIKARNDLKFILLQARLDKMKYHEHECFSRRSGLHRDNIQCFDLTKGIPEKEFINEFDGIFIGGSGEFSIGVNPPSWLYKVEDLIKWIIDADKPMFASCFGHQIMGRALGARVEHIPDKLEVGTFIITFSENGTKDILFKNYPKKIFVQLGHQDHVIDLPGYCSNLGSTKLCEMQAFRVNDRLIYTSQFHPELTYDDMLLRIEFYASHGYMEEGRTMEDVKKEFKEAPDSYSILFKFIDIVLAKINE